MGDILTPAEIRAALQITDADRLRAAKLSAAAKEAEHAFADALEAARVAQRAEERAFYEQEACREALKAKESALSALDDPRAVVRCGPLGTVEQPPVVRILEGKGTKWRTIGAARAWRYGDLWHVNGRRGDEYWRLVDPPPLWGGAAGDAAGNGGGESSCG